MKRSLNAYYYSFDPTGCDEVDAILEAVARAGKAFHCTSDWQEADHTGEGVADRIQRVANELAAKLVSESQQASSVGGEREAFLNAAAEHIRENPDDWVLLNGHDDEERWAFWGWKARAALSPAGGGVVMPERQSSPAGARYYPPECQIYDDAWNDCLDEVARLNAK